MTNFNLYSFISNHVLPRSNTNDITSNHNAKENFNNFTSKEAIQQLYPCEDRHSFNPHYQHNLHSTSPYSTPPSLSSSPTNSSPSSTTSSASSHLLLNSGHRPYYQYNHHPSKRSVSHSGWHHQQQQQQRQRQQHQHHNRSNSYNRQHTKRQSQDHRHYSNQQHLDALDDDLMVGYDGQRIFYESGACSMARVHPSGSPSYSSYPSDTSTTFGGRHHPSQQQEQQNQQQNQQRGSSQISWSENENTASPASQSLSAAATAATTVTRPMHASTPDTINNHNHIQSGQNSATSLLPRISEATVHENNETVVVAEGDNASTLGPHKTSSKSKSDARMTARYSLMRIVQCDVRHNDWCPQQSGQWTRHYAGTRSLGVKVDGRRTGRL